MVTREIEKSEPLFGAPFRFRLPAALTAGRLFLIGLALLVVSLSGYFYFRSATKESESKSEETSVVEVLDKAGLREAAEQLQMDGQTALRAEETLRGGRLVVEWPTRLARGWSRRIKVVYLPPAGAGQRDFMPGYALYLVPRITDPNGLDVPPSDSPLEDDDTWLLSGARREWAFDVAVFEETRHEASCTLGFSVFLRERETSKTVGLPASPVEFKTATFPVSDKLLTEKQTTTGTIASALTSLVFMGTGLIRGRRGAKQFPKTSQPFPSRRARPTCPMNSRRSYRKTGARTQYPGELEDSP